MDTRNAFNSDVCKNCNRGLTTKYLTITDEERKRGIHTKYARVHEANGLWECPNGSGLNPHSDDIMPVLLLTDIGALCGRT
jgi:hypothetical protein